MTEVFVKKYVEEEENTFYLHFQDGEAVRQVEVSAEGKFFFSTENPTCYPHWSKFSIA